MTRPVSDLLREARLLRHMTQAELARRSGISQSVISAYETGRRDPTPSSLTRLLDALDHDLGAFPRCRIGPAEWDLQQGGCVDIERNGRLLPDLLAITDAIPLRRRGGLEYPRLDRLGARR